MAKYMGRTKKEFIYPIKHPDCIEWNKEYDKRRQFIFLRVNGNYVYRHLRYFYLYIKDWFYFHLSKKQWELIKKILKH